MDRDCEATAGAILRLDLGALVSNYRSIARWGAPAEVAAVVKADAYGLGIGPVANALAEAGCRRFFVAHLSEAAALRQAYAGAVEVAVLNGLIPGAEQRCHALDAVPVLNSIDQLQRWRALARRISTPLPCMLQFDTGMTRLGLSPEEFNALLAEPDWRDGLDIRLLLSHLACADDPSAPSNARQAARFAELCSRLPGVPRSLDNSGGALLDRSEKFELVRAGIALFGGAPHIGANPMRPVVSLDARIIQLRDVPAGTGVGYGMTHRTAGPSRLATLAIGYGDGWPRALSNRGSAFVAEHRAPIVGRVSMDSLMIDVTGIAEAHLQPGALVELIGSHQSIDEVARDAGTISYEILTQLGTRYARDYQVAPALPLRKVASL